MHKKYVLWYLHLCVLIFKHNHIKKLHSCITMPEKWSEEDDIKLWSLRAKPVPQLSATFNKTAGAIRSRLIHLQDPTHKAYQRRVKNGDSDRKKK